MIAEPIEGNPIFSPTEIVEPTTKLLVLREKLVDKTLEKWDAREVAAGVE